MMKYSDETTQEELDLMMAAVIQKHRDMETIRVMIVLLLAAVAAGIVIVIFR